MHSNARGKVQPYGREWNGDRSAPDYDPQRDPWNPLSPVHGQWQRRSTVRDLADEPIWLVLAAWLAATLALVLLLYFNVLARDTLFIFWMGKYVVLLAGLIIAGAWSGAKWLRRTPQAERAGVYRRWFKSLPRNLAWLVGGLAVCAGLEWLDKWAGVPFLFTGGALFATLFAVSCWPRQKE